MKRSPYDDDDGFSGDMLAAVVWTCAIVFAAALVISILL